MVNHKNILILDSGAIGGGSANSLYNHIKSFRKNDSFNFIAVFLTENNFSRMIRDLGIKVYILDQTILNTKYAKTHPVKLFFHKVIYKILSHTYSDALYSYEKFIFKALISQLKNIMVEEKIDILHTNNQPNRDFYAIYAASQLSIPVVSHIRTSNTFGFANKKAKYCNEFVNHYIAYTEATKDIWCDVKVDESKVTVVNNAMDSIEIEKKNLLEQYKDKKVILLLGRIKPSRGYDFFLEVVQKLSKERNDFTVVVVGDYFGYESYYEKLLSLIKQYKIDDYVSFYGYSNEALNIIEESDMLVLPYRVESFGRIVLEAWQLKTPVLMSNNGKIDKYVQHKQNGMLFEYGNVDNCFNSIVDVLDDNSLQENLIENGFKSYEENYTLEQYNKKVIAVYNSI